MGFLKGLLSFILFLALAVFGIVFMLKSTILSPDFVVAQIDRMELASLADELVGEESGGDSPELQAFFRDVAPAVVADLEPELKEQIDNAVYDGYDYLLGKSQQLNITISLVDLKEELKDSLWRFLDEYFSENPSALAESVLRDYLDNNYDDVMGQVPDEYLPAEVSAMTGEELDSYLEENYLQLLEQVPEEELAEMFELFKAEFQPYYEQYYQELTTDIPDEVVISGSDIPVEVMTVLADVRDIVGYLMLSFYLLIALMVLLIGLIILIDRKVKGATRGLGINFLLCGVLEMAFVLLARHFTPQLVSSVEEFPASLQTWVVGLTGDLMTPAFVFALGLMIAGAVLIIVSIVVKERPKAQETGE